MNDESLPLTGFRVLTCEQYGAGPYGTMFLAQLGAEVIKIEPPNLGDSARVVGPHWLDENESLYFQAFNLNKKSITLDIATEVGRKIFNLLVETADAFANNLRGDLPKKLGLDYAELGKINKRIVCAHLSAYGRDNHRTAWPGYDYLMQAESGYCYLTGEPGGNPTRFGLSMVDFMTGSVMATGLLSALLKAQKFGIGCDIDTDLLSVALHQTSYPALWYLNEGDITERTPRSAHPSVTPSQLFKAKDGWMFVMAQLPRFWDNLVFILNIENIAKSPKFCDYEARLKNRDELTQVFDAIFEKETIAHWMRLLGGKVPIAPALHLNEAMENPFLNQIGMLQEISHPKRDDLKTLSNPIKISGKRIENLHAPLLGQNTKEILEQLGFKSDEISHFKDSGVI